MRSHTPRRRCSSQFMHLCESILVPALPITRPTLLQASAGVLALLILSRRKMVHCREWPLLRIIQ
jgi:hypothetical protein